VTRTGPQAVRLASGQSIGARRPGREAAVSRLPGSGVSVGVWCGWCGVWVVVLGGVGGVCGDEGHGVGLRWCRVVLVIPMPDFCRLQAPIDRLSM
jgi:hypothetical protein